MISPQQDHIPDQVRDAEQTLRLIATMPAPDGLIERVQSNLRTAPRASFLMSWRASFDGWMFSPALRGAAAAAIVCVVAGGGWGIYSRVQPGPTARVIVVPARVGPNGGFSSANAIRTPDTLNGPVLAHPVVPEKQNTVAVMPGAKPETLKPQPKHVPHRKKATASGPVR